MYLAAMTGLSYDIYAIGETTKECYDNLVKGFERYIKCYSISVEEWVEGTGEDFSDYNNDVLTFLQNYYGTCIHSMKRGHCIGWDEEEEVNMEFRNKVSDYATMSKKGNMMYWDEIDNLAEEYVRQIIEFSVKKLDIPDFVGEEDMILEVGKEVTECVINYLEKNYGAEFPYVDENY